MPQTHIKSNYRKPTPAERTSSSSNTLWIAVQWRLLQRGIIILSLQFSHGCIEKKSFYNSRILWMMKQHQMIIGQDHLLKLINYHNWKSLQSFNSNYDVHFLPKWLAIREEGRRLLLQLSSQIRKSKVEYNLNFFMPIINYVLKIYGHSCLFTKETFGKLWFLLRKLSRFSDRCL